MGRSGGGGVGQMTQVMKRPPCCAGSSHVRLCSLPLSGHYAPPPRAPRGSKFTYRESIRAGGAKGGRTGTVDEVRGEGEEREGGL